MTFKTFFGKTYENDNDEAMSRKYGYNYDCLKKMYPDVYKLSEEDIKPMINKLYEGPANESFEDMTQRIQSYTKEKEPSWNSKKQVDSTQPYKIGTLSGYFESKHDPKAIGKDTNGGHSYGQYQISTRKGTMGDYIKYLNRQDKYKSFANTLNNCGGEIGAINRTPEFENCWKNLSSTPDFNQSQEEFLIKANLGVALSNIKDIKGLNLDKRHPVVKDAIFSAAIQHGGMGAAGVIKDAFKDNPNIENLTDEEILNRLYNERGKVDEHFKSLENGEKTSVKNRFPQELQKALEYLKKDFY